MSLGTGFEITHIPPDEKILYKVHEEGTKKFDEIKMQLCRVLLECNNIQRSLEDIISLIHLETNSNDETKNRLSFSRTKQKLQSIIKKYPEFFTNEYQQTFFDTLDSIIKVRNAFAHGTIIWNYESDKLCLRYLDNKKLGDKEIILDSTFFAELDDKLQIVKMKILSPKNGLLKSEIFPEMLLLRYHQK
jgi:hypothetical protein